MEGPRKGTLHWENPKARDTLLTSGAMSVLLAELIREYLEFYQLDYTKQIFLPESNLMTHNSSSNEQLAEKTNIKEADEKKPLLL